MAGLFSFLRRRPAPVSSFSPLTRPDRALAVIGDLHGRLDLLAAMQAKITMRAKDALVIVVGDMIDRGPDSAGVLRALYAQSTASPDHMICLMGNHERMLLDFLEAPARHGSRWLGHGGAETLASFGLKPWARGAESDPRTRLEALAIELCDALGPDVLAWLRALPLHWHEGVLAVTHAGADPDRPIGAQEPASLLWGHRRFLHKPRRDGIWVVHGHTIVKTAAAADGRIAVDTGAWRSDRLSAALIDDFGLEFLEVSACPPLSEGAS